MPRICCRICGDDDLTIQTTYELPTRRRMVVVQHYTCRLCGYAWREPDAAELRRPIASYSVSLLVFAGYFALVITMFALVRTWEVSFINQLGIVFGAGIGGALVLGSLDFLLWRYGMAKAIRAGIGGSLFTGLPLLIAGWNSVGHRLWGIAVGLAAMVLLYRLFFRLDQRLSTRSR